MGDAASKATPATLSPSPSVPDHDDMNDPSFTFGLSQAEAGNPVAPGVSKSTQGAYQIESHPFSTLSMISLCAVEVPLADLVTC